VDDELRKQLYVMFRSRGDNSNEAVLRDVLKLRAEKASLLGFANWADYITADKMIRSGDNAAEFLDKVWKLAEPRAKRDYADLLDQLRTLDPKATAVADWQKIFLENEIKKVRYEVDASEVRRYFPYRRVLEGLLAITSEIFDLTYVPATDASLWHPSVLAYDVMRGAAKLGRIYLDMHPREGKYKHAAQFPLKDGVKDVQLPEGVLVCNFPNPGASAEPALMEHDDVVTMFHEFGHLMHHVLGGHQSWVTLSGVATEWDFVEAPSQMLEEWAWNADVLHGFATDADGRPIPSELVARMRDADEFGKGYFVRTQMFYAALSYLAHRDRPDDLTALVRELQRKYDVFDYIDNTHFQASFGHLAGYTSGYYTYMWSLVIAKDLLSAFDRDNLLDPVVAQRYRDAVLVPGGSGDAADLVESFLGRPYSFEAFARWLDSVPVSRTG